MSKQEEESKPVWQSKTVISAFVAMVIGVLGAFGVGKIDVEAENITQIIMSLTTAIASAIAIYGRITAKKKLK